MDSEVVKIVLGKLRKGRGAEVILTYGRPYRIVFIPSTLYSDQLALELLIVCEGKGSYFYDGKVSLNKFKLVSSGYPIDLAEEVASFVGQIMKQIQTVTLPVDQIQPQLQSGALAN